jgi:hypothetical protein
MRLHITLDDDLVQQLDDHVGPRGRSAFIVRAVEQALDSERRWQLLQSTFGGIADTGHEWDDDPAAWVERIRSEGEPDVDEAAS